MLDSRHIGHVLTPHRAVVEAGRLRFSPRPPGKAIRSISTRPRPRPPAIRRCWRRRPSILSGTGRAAAGEAYRLLDIGFQRILHGEQRFDYRGPVFAGDVLDYASRIADIYVKRSRSGGELGFLEIETTVSKADGQAVAELRRITVVRPA